MHQVEVSTERDDRRPAVLLDEVAGARLDAVKASRAADAVTYLLRRVRDFVLHNCPGLADVRREAVERETF